MPMLTTLRMRSTGVAFPLAATNLVRERGHPVEHRVYVGHDVVPVDDDLFSARRTQCDVQDCAILGRIDLVAAEHRLDALPEAAGFGELAQKRIVSASTRCLE